MTWATGGKWARVHLLHSYCRLHGQRVTWSLLQLTLHSSCSWMQEVKANFKSGVVDANVWKYWFSTCIFLATFFAFFIYICVLLTRNSSGINSNECDVRSCIAVKGSALSRNVSLSLMMAALPLSCFVFRVAQVTSFLERSYRLLSWIGDLSSENKLTYFRSTTKRWKGSCCSARVEMTEKTPHETWSDRMRHHNVTIKQCNEK